MLMCLAQSYKYCIRLANFYLTGYAILDCFSLFSRFWAGTCSLSLSLFPFGCIAGAFTTNYMMPLDRLTVSRTSSLLPYFGLCVYLGYMLSSLGEVTMKKKMY